jgi:hypothetical protein
MSTFALVDLEESSVRQASATVLLSTAAFATHVVNGLYSAAAFVDYLQGLVALVFLPIPRHERPIHHTVYCFSCMCTTMNVLQVIGAAIKCSLAVPQHPWSADYVLESVLSELTAPSITHNSSSVSNDSNDYAAVNATNPSQPVNSAGKASRAAAAAAAAEPAGIADTPSSGSSVKLLPEVAALLEDFTAAAAAAAGDEAPSYGKSNGVAAASGGTRRSRSHSRPSSRAVADSHDLTDEQVEQLQAMFSQLLYEEYQQVTCGDSVLQAVQDVVVTSHQSTKHGASPSAIESLK